jgi:hypothetical protein
VLARAGISRRIRRAFVPATGRIDGFSITGGDIGNGIFVNGWVRPRLATTGSEQASRRSQVVSLLRTWPTRALRLQPDVRIHNNAITQNGALAGSGGGGVALCTGTDEYQLFDNWVCGNFSQGHGGGVAHFGRSDDGLIRGNRILFNQSFNQGLTKSGGGIWAGGEPPPPLGGLSLGAGRNLVIDANLVQGNHAGAGHGGGVRLEWFNGADLARVCWGPMIAADACYQARLTTT